MTTRRHIRKLLLGWVGGLILFIITVGAGVLTTQYFPADSAYGLSIDFVSFRKLEYFAKADKDFSTPLVDVSELNAKMEVDRRVTTIKISSLQAPFSDVNIGLLSFFITSEDETNPYILLSATVFSKNYIKVTSELGLSLVKKPLAPVVIRMKLNGLNEKPYFKIDLPPNDDLDSVTLADSLYDTEFKNFNGEWKKILLRSNLPDMKKWASEVLVYYYKDSDGLVHISHFLPLVLREFYE